MKKSTLRALKKKPQGIIGNDNNNLQQYVKMH